MRGPAPHSFRTTPLAFRRPRGHPRRVSADPGRLEGGARALGTLGPYVPTLSNWASLRRRARDFRGAVAGYDAVLPSPRTT